MASVDVAVVGDGPAGSALAAALQRLGCSVVLHGLDQPWLATYGTWIDDVVGHDDIWATRLDTIDVRFDQARTVNRAYGVVDNDALREELRSDVEYRRGKVHLDDLDATIIVDATGWPSALVAVDASEVEPATSVGWQTAFGVVLSEPPEGPLGSPMLMDFTDPGPDDNVADGGDVGVPTFAYALPVADGWLVEETVLVGSPPVEPVLLRGRLARRLATTPAQLAAAARRIETVHIPMGAPARGASGNVVRFGAAAGMINPTTGYSLAASLSSAPRVAHRLGALVDRGTSIDPGELDAVVWPRGALRTRALHDYGLEVLADLGGDEIRSFFATFFSLDDAVWPRYLRIDTPPAAMARTMLQMFGRADGKLRRRLLSGDLRQLVSGVFRPKLPADGPLAG